MVKTPRTRHSKSEREPVTIELGPDDVSRLARKLTPRAAEQAPDGVKEDIGASEAAEPPAEAVADAAGSEATAESVHQAERGTCR